MKHISIKLHVMMECNWITHREIKFKTVDKNGAKTDCETFEMKKEKHKRTLSKTVKLEMKEKKWRGNNEKDLRTQSCLPLRLNRNWYDFSVKLQSVPANMFPLTPFWLHRFCQILKNHDVFGMFCQPLQQTTYSSRINWYSLDADWSKKRKFYREIRRKQVQNLWNHGSVFEAKRRCLIYRQKRSQPNVFVLKSAAMSMAKSYIRNCNSFYTRFRFLWVFATVERRFAVLCLWFYIAREKRLLFCLLNLFYYCFYYWKTWMYCNS